MEIPPSHQGIMGRIAAVGTALVSVTHGENRGARARRVSYALVLALVLHKCNLGSIGFYPTFTEGMTPIDGPAGPMGTGAKS